MATDITVPVLQLNDPMHEGCRLRELVQLQSPALAEVPQTNHGALLRAYGINIETASDHDKIVRMGDADAPAVYGALWMHNHTARFSFDVDNLGTTYLPIVQMAVTTILAYWLTFSEWRALIPDCRSIGQREENPTFVYTGQPPVTAFEHYACTYAVEYLMPASIIKKIFRTGDTINYAELRRKSSAVDSMAEVFEVPYWAAAHRLRDLAACYNNDRDD